MSLRKFIPIAIFLAGAFFGKPIAIGVVGLFAKAYLYFENGWQFSYRSVDWHEGKLIFKDAVLTDPGATLAAKRISLFWRARHLEIERPSIAIRKMPDFKGGVSDWTVEMHDGTIAHDDLGHLRFSFEKTWRHHLGRLLLDAQGSRLSLEAIQEENEIWIDAELMRFDAAALRFWTDLRGIADGRIHLVFEGSQCKRGSAQLSFHDAGYRDAFLNGAGQLDWEGDVGASPLLNTLESGRFRLDLRELTLNGPKGGIDSIRGDCSFTSGVGAKWDFSGFGSANEVHFPMEWRGRAFLHETRPRWVESQIGGVGGQILIHGGQEEEGFRWKGEGAGIGAVLATLIQSLSSSLDPMIEALTIDEGKFQFDGELLFGKDWRLALKGEHLSGSFMDSSARCRFGEAEWTSYGNGAFRFEGLSAKSQFGGKTFAVEEWQGRGVVDHGALAHSEFDGKIENQPFQVHATGKADGFRLEARGEQGEIALRGFWKDRLEAWIDKGKFDGLVFSGDGWIGPDGTFALNLSQFDGALTPLARLLGKESKGTIRSIGGGFSAEGTLTSCDWTLQAKGELGGGAGFYCPWIEKRGMTITFDFRIETPAWDLVRLVGTAEEGNCSFDPAKTHFLGSTLHIDQCTWDTQGIASMQMKAPVSWNSLLAAAPIWFPETADWISLPLDGLAAVEIAYERGEGIAISALGETLSWKGEPVFFQMSAHEHEGVWEIPALQVGECAFSMAVKREGQSLQFEGGRASWKGGGKGEFEGHLDASFQFELRMSQFTVELGRLGGLAQTFGIPLSGLEGILEGKGVIARRNRLEADFDFEVSELKASSLKLSNSGAIHLHYASDAGIVCSGLDILAEGADAPYFGCKIGLLHYDANRSFWILSHGRFRLSPAFLDLFPNRPCYVSSFNPSQEVEFSADLECPSDFSSLAGWVKEAAVPFDGMLRPVKNLSFFFDDSEAKARFDLDHQGYPVKVFAQAEFEEALSGRLILEDGDCPLSEGERPLSIDWTYSAETGLSVREIEGRFGGVDASFHALDGGMSLIGSARVDFGRVSRIIPARIAQVFTDLQMGKGYELKGKLHLDRGISFRGLFSGKQIDLFGFQLRTLLAQFEFDPDRLRLYDLKISDSAGMLKIDELVASVEGDAPWTISIPHLSILELRPSLLQKEGRPAEPAGPLVVRELRIDDFKGLLEESKTYTAQGELAFINSYRREHTVFDIPSDLLSRIVGLDLELLIPACGLLRYELKDGFFFLTALSQSFSEAQRSEFFLVPDPSPVMDLDGNLRILVSMKQFVLFKLTESFQILIDGKLNDPQFHLQKKKRFLGL